MVIKLVPFWKTVWPYISSVISFDTWPFLFYSVHYLLLIMAVCQWGPKSPIYPKDLAVTFGRRE